MAAIYSPLPYNFFSKKTLEVKFSGLDLSSDAGLLLVRQAEQGQQICQGLTQCLEDQRDPSKIKHTMSQKLSQRIYQIAGGDEDANDSNYLRHDPILKIASDANTDSGRRTISQSAHDEPPLKIKSLPKNSQRFDGYLWKNSFKVISLAPEEIILDVDGWDAQTYGAQQLSMFHGYYGHKMYYPVLINEASSGYPLILQLRAGNSHSGKGIAGIQRMVILATEKSLAPSTNYLARRCGIFAT